MPEVFVYGTLKRGEANHHWLRGARFLGRRRLVGARLHDLGPYPMAIPVDAAEAGPQDQGTPADPLVHGELYGVGRADLAWLDGLEDVPREYRRLRRRLSDGQRAWVYLGRPEQVRGHPLVPFADWGSTPVFSYGSNLCPDQLRHRCADWDGSGLVVRLEGWRWGICKIRSGQDPAGTQPEGAAGIQPDPGTHCWGVIHHLRPADRGRIDRHEGVALGHYRRISVAVTTEQGERFEASTYAPSAAWSAPGLRSGEPYAQRILAGLAHWPFPEEWRRTLAEHLGPAMIGGIRSARPIDDSPGASVSTAICPDLSSRPH